MKINLINFERMCVGVLVLFYALANKGNLSLRDFQCDYNSKKVYSTSVPRAETHLITWTVIIYI